VTDSAHIDDQTAVCRATATAGGTMCCTAVTVQKVYELLISSINLVPAQIGCLRIRAAKPEIKHKSLH